MKKASHSVFLAASLLFVSASSWAVETVDFVQFEVEFPPHQYLDKGIYKGPDIDQIRAAFKRMPDYDLSVTVLPVRRGVIDFHEGKVDSVLGYNFERFHKSMVITETPLHRNVFRPVSLAKNSLSINSIEDMHGLSFATINFNPLNPEILAAEQAGKIKLLRISDYKRLYQMLQKGRVDAVLTTYITIQAFHKEGDHELEVSDYSLFPPQGVYFCTSLKSKIKDKHKLARDLNAALLELHKDGSHQRILEAHNVTLDAEHSPLIKTDMSVIPNSSYDSKLLNTKR